MRKKPKWPNILSKPILLPSMEALLVSDEERQQQYSEQFGERIEALFQHYDVTGTHDQKWMLLVYRMVRDLIPAFQVKYQKAETKGWRGTGGTELFADVQSLVREGKTERQACKILETSRRFSRRYGGKSSLWPRYMEVKKSHWFLTKLVTGDEERRRHMTTIIIENFALFGFRGEKKPKS